MKFDYQDDQLVVTFKPEDSVESIRILDYFIFTKENIVAERVYSNFDVSSLCEHIVRYYELIDKKELIPISQSHFSGLEKRLQITGVDDEILLNYIKIVKSNNSGSFWKTKSSSKRLEHLKQSISPFWVDISQFNEIEKFILSEVSDLGETN